MEEGPIAAVAGVCESQEGKEERRVRGSICGYRQTNNKRMGKRAKRSEGDLIETYYCPSFPHWSCLCDNVLETLDYIMHLPRNQLHRK